uniref:Uncharacterized protein n=1 Tax=Anguilla anguilla TaxID=7936 RepID=A0A0E9TVM1_ANGAN
MEQKRTNILCSEIMFILLVVRLIQQHRTVLSNPPNPRSEWKKQNL